jgi:hypothetical protein
MSAATDYLTSWLRRVNDQTGLRMTVTMSQQSSAENLPGEAGYGFGVADSPMRTSVSVRDVKLEFASRSNFSPALADNVDIALSQGDDDRVHLHEINHSWGDSVMDSATSQLDVSGTQLVFVVPSAGNGPFDATLLVSLYPVSIPG